MPTICKKDTCRSKAIYGYCFGKPLFCSVHREDGSKNTRSIEPPDVAQPTCNNVCLNCGSNGVLPRFKGYCKRCYVEKYPVDPLSLQTVYKSKEDVIQKFIDSKFDGFVHKQGLSEIQINGVVLQVVYDDKIKIADDKNIVIKFNPNKYADGKNPFLYTRLPQLEREITKRFEMICVIKETKVSF